MSNKNEPPFKIVPNSIVKGTKEGYYYCQTEPVHPNAESRPDRKAKYIYLHRVVMENHLGRLLDPATEQVDHLDKDKSNNDISNLKLVLKGEHQRDHVSRGNHFWKTSPLNKPHKKRHKKASLDTIHNILMRYFESFYK